MRRRWGWPESGIAPAKSLAPAPSSESPFLLPSGTGSEELLRQGSKAHIIDGSEHSLLVLRYPKSQERAVWVLHGGAIGPILSKTLRT